MVPICSLTATLSASIEAKIIDYEFDFLSPNMITLLLSGCLQTQVAEAGIQKETIDGDATRRKLCLTAI